ncbi:FGGY family carbohydrate kinase [Reichenbachiella ulvae]|uniref:FGGY family carbohydrate kinase n=1 Tax=Reichenbachiella ulvae TaxID=2980104 RepID=A0ABT3CSF3_9BACT|nr:FGGY family carbohydrate kinase [Reichenbachiella ulvae]MCV9386630.1 FGGY family carbohydrate kinase [Reichenbachiella ulvae]
MEVKEVIAVFDIGKTNKKFYVFDKEFNPIEFEYTQFDEIPDDEGFLGENLDALTGWVISTFDSLLENEKFKVDSLNFSTYGASLVHIDKDGNRVTPFYNYLKPFPKQLEEQFKRLISQEQFELETASPLMGFLNSGLQLYYLKYQKPTLFAKIKHSIHLPQYLSSLYTNEYVADYTSIGCHTGLWDFNTGQYSDWVKKEKLDSLMAPIVPSTHTKMVERKGQIFKVGVGVHDSSSTLIPYINSTDEPFVLMSTGTWSICMNFFNEGAMTNKELECDCLNFLSLKGSALKASRLFLGKHLTDQAHMLSDYFGYDKDAYQKLEWQEAFESKRKNSKQLLFDHSLIHPERFGFVNNPVPDLDQFDSFEDALYHLYDELVDIQVASLDLAIGKSDIKRVYVDGGISASKVFVGLLSKKLSKMEILNSELAVGSALGAALLVNYRNLTPTFLEQNYQSSKQVEIS